MSGYKPRNATESFMLGEIEYLKKEIENYKERINILEEDNYRLEQLNKLNKSCYKKCEENYEKTHTLWQSACLESDCHGIELEERVRQLEEELGNLQCEFGFECEENAYWKRVNKRLRILLNQNNIHYDINGETTD